MKPSRIPEESELQIAGIEALPEPIQRLFLEGVKRGSEAGWMAGLSTLADLLAKKTREQWWKGARSQELVFEANELIKQIKAMSQQPPELKFEAGPVLEVIEAPKAQG